MVSGKEPDDRLSGEARRFEERGAGSDGRPRSSWEDARIPAAKAPRESMHSPDCGGRSGSRAIERETESQAVRRGHASFLNSTFLH